MCPPGTWSDGCLGVRCAGKGKAEVKALLILFVP